MNSSLLIVVKGLKIRVMNVMKLFVMMKEPVERIKNFYLFKRFHLACYFSRDF